MVKNPQNSYEISSPLLSCVPQTALDAVYGAAALADVNQNLSVLSRNWNEFMARSGRGDLAKNSVLGSSLLSFFRDEQQKQVFRNLLESMANDELGTHNQVVDLGGKDNPFYVQFHVHPLWKDGVLVGYLLHCLDTTKEHANRLTLIDHDRQLLHLREIKATHESELNAAKELIGSVAKEQADKEKELKQLQEKAARKEKALKAAIKQAELSANNMASKDRELDTLRAENKKFITDLAETRQQLDLAAAELTAREETISRLSDQLSELKSVNDELSEKLNSQDTQDSALTDKLQEYEQSNSALTEELKTLRDEKNLLTAELENSKEQLSNLKLNQEQQQEAFEEINRELAAKKTNSEHELQSLRADRILLSNTLNALNTPVCWMDPSGLIQLTNQAFREYFELDHESPEAVNLSELIAEADARRVESMLRDPFNTDCLTLHFAQSETELSIRIAPQFENGQFIGCFAVSTRNPNHELNALTHSEESQPDARGVRVLSGDLADSFGDLLTAVVGHASLAAAEAEENSPTLADIRAIEESAGEAAHLVRKLHALSGKSRHNSITDLKASIMNFTSRYYDSEREESRIQIELTSEPVRIPADHATIDVILNAIAAQAELSADAGSTPLWKLSADEEFAKLSISCQGTLTIPTGWFDESVPSKDEQGYDLYFAREAARAFGGRLEIHDLKPAQELILYLPLAAVKSEA
ncbi:PAS domain-containing protein [bacterium]|nr:PAS domain-containing protein [bacterium]